MAAKPRVPRAPKPKNKPKVIRSLRTVATPVRRRRRRRRVNRVEEVAPPTANTVPIPTPMESDDELLLTMNRRFVRRVTRIETRLAMLDSDMAFVVDIVRKLQDATAPAKVQRRVRRRRRKPAAPTE